MDAAYALSEALYSALALAAAAWLGSRDGWPAPRPHGVRRDARIALAGLAAGAGALTRPAMLFFLPLAAALLLWRAPSRRVGLRRAVLFVGAALVVIAPWTVRNAASTSALRADRVRRRRHLLDRQPSARPAARATWPPTRA